MEYVDPSAILASSWSANCPWLSTYKTIVDIVFHLRRLSEFRFVLDSSSMQRLISASITLRIDYCNEVLPGLPASKLSLDPLQRVLNAAACFRVDAGKS